MLSAIAKKVFGSRNERLIGRMQRTVKRINELEGEFKALSDEELKAKTQEFRDRLAQGETVDALLPEAFATVREASQRTLGMRHYDVQLIGAMALHDGKIAEMKTGEGKTLMATLAVYLNALPDKGVHVVTVNDYLARRDAEWMAKLYGFLGLTTGVVVPGQSPEEKREAYAADITYGTNNEFGFDYLRDNMAFRAEDRMQRGLHYAIVDEVDSILIDEARTPLIISGPAEESSEQYLRMNRIAPRLKRQAAEEVDSPEDEGDYYVDEKARQVHITESGHERVEELLREEGLLQEGEGLYDVRNLMLVHHLNAALRAHALFQRDVHYLIRDGEVVIVDEFTGRAMPGRRWSDGLHQAVEAKEGVSIQSENQTLASITFQNYFRMYEKLAGMTGTADTEAFEFQQIYGLEVVVIPTHRPMIRRDNNDLVYMSTREKFDAIVEDIRDCVKRGQPVLVGTASIETSEYLSNVLRKEKIPHEVLNAKQHEREAHIIAQAGQPSSVTIATNMAGRGTDIVLGGSVDAEIEALGENPDPQQVEQIRRAWEERHQRVVEAGGLHVIGTERHESRRIDNQLRGRSGRQGDPGSTRFYLSLEDNLLRIFASERVQSMMQRLGMQEGEAIESGLVSRVIENAQRKVEAHNFDIRKHLLDFDDVANDQRRVIYAQRNELLEADEVGDAIESMREDVVDNVISQYIPPGSIDEQWDVPGLEAALQRDFAVSLPIRQWLDEEDDLHEESLRERILEKIVESYREKEALAGSEILRQFEKAMMLRVLDQQWKEHLAAMDYLRQGIHLRGYAQRNPKQEFKREAFEMFSEMLDRIKHEIISIVSRAQVRAQEDVDAVDEQRRQSANMQFRHAEPVSSVAGGGPSAGAGTATAAGRASGAQAASNVAPFVRQGRKVGRNEACPCGSGKKYKHCHGRLSG